LNLQLATLQIGRNARKSYLRLADAPKGDQAWNTLLQPPQNLFSDRQKAYSWRCPLARYLDARCATNILSRPTLDCQLKTLDECLHETRKRRVTE